MLATNQQMGRYMGNRQGFLVMAALGAMLATTERADGCPIAVEGEPESSAALRQSLAPFGDDGAPCLTLRVVTAIDGDGRFAVELHDELGQVARRTFATADGAAAFVASWSRRPLPDHEGPPGASPAVATRLEAIARPTEATTSVELRVDEAWAFAARSVTSAAVDVRRSTGGYHYGAELRVLGTDSQITALDVPQGTDYVGTWLGIDAVGTVGVTTGSERFQARAEALFGGTAILGRRQFSGSFMGDTAGVRAGVRGDVAAHLVGALWLDAGAGWDLVLLPVTGARPFGDRSVATTPHVEIGLMWRQ